MAISTDAVNATACPTAGVDLLVSPDADGFFGAAVAAAGGRLISTRPTQVYTTRGSGAVASYTAVIDWPRRGEQHELLAACTGGDLPSGVPIVESGADRVAVWAFPHDPDLPALARGNDPAAVGRLVAQLGIDAGAVRLVVRSYRPRRRAVIEVTGTGGTRAFLKVVGPLRVERLHRRHRLSSAHGVPSPRSLGWTDDGLLVLQALPGCTLRRAIRDGAPVPAAASILALLDRLPAELCDGPPRASWLDRVGHYASIVSGIAPNLTDRITYVAESIRAEAGTGPTVPVHGDFYENQLLVDGTTITGLIDLDSAGAGDRLDDLACLLAHLSVLAHTTDRHRASRINAVGKQYLAAFERATDPRDLRYRVAAVVVSLAPGPHRVQHPHWPETTVRLVDLAERWLEAARRARRR